MCDEAPTFTTEVSEVSDVSEVHVETEVETPRGKSRGVFREARARGGQVPRKQAIDSAKRRVVAKVLRSGEELPLEYLLEEMRTYATRARTIERVSTAEGMTREMAEEAVAYRGVARAAAVAAAPYVHARLAPLVQKGDKGLTVNLVIEDA